MILYSVTVSHCVFVSLKEEILDSAIAKGFIVKHNFEVNFDKEIYTILVVIFFYLVLTLPLSLCYIIGHSL